MAILDSLDRSDCPDACPDVHGGTTGRVQALLAGLAASLRTGETYLEIGCLYGKSLVPAARAAPSGVAVVACDKFCGGWGGSGDPVVDNDRDRFYATLAKYGLSDRVRVLEGDFHETLVGPDVPRNVGACFYDADHTERSTTDALRLLVPVTVPGAIVVVDDWIAPEVQNGAASAIRQGGYTLLALRPEDMQTDRDLWWRGIGILRRDDTP